MVALVVVLGDHLPVRRDLVGVPVGQHQRARARTARRDRPASPRCSSNDGTSGCRAGAARGRRPSPARPRPAARPGRARRGSNPSTSRKPGRGDERAVEVVGPGVVGADDAAPLRGLAVREQLVAAVPAGVREHPRRGRRRPDQQRGDVADRDRPLGDGAPSAAVGSSSSRRPRQVQLPANRCRRSQASTSARCRPRRAASAPGRRRPEPPRGRLSSRRRPGCRSSPCLRTVEPSASRGRAQDRRTAEVRREELLAATTDLLARVGLAPSGALLVSSGVAADAWISRVSFVERPHPTARNGGRR